MEQSSINTVSSETEHNSASRRAPGRVRTKVPPTPFLGALAQMGERFHGMEEVIGSIPIGSTKFPTEPTGHYGALAHLGERLICIQKVIGSSPIGSTIFRPRRWNGLGVLSQRMRVRILPGAPAYGVVASGKRPPLGRVTGGHVARPTPPTTLCRCASRLARLRTEDNPCPSRLPTMLPHHPAQSYPCP
jgi:hypothetical protein